MRSRALRLCVTVVVNVAAALLVVEVAARVAGYRPRVPDLQPHVQMYRSDPVVSWRLLPGRYAVGPFVPGGEVTTVTVRPDGARLAGPEVAEERPQVLLVGCSMTMGQAVSDDETFAWHLQAHRPDVEVQNYGHSGYGTVQSLLLLEQLLATGKRPAWVLYGDIGHEPRNVAAPDWLKTIGGNSSTPVEIPYATLDANGQVMRHPPIGWPSVPLHEYLAAAVVLERAWSEVRPIPTWEQSQSITEGLIKEMAATARAHGARFSIVLLELPDTTAWDRLRFAQDHDVDVINCRETIDPEDKVPGEGHPNAGVHRRWGDCIAAAMADRLPRS